MAYAIGSTSRNGQTGVLMSDGSFVPQSNSSINIGGNQALVGGQKISTGSVLSTNTGFGGNGGGSSSQPQQQQTLSNPYNGAGDAAKSQQQAELDSLNTQYDQSASLANQQLGSLATQKQNALTEYDQLLSGVAGQVKTSKDASQSATDQNVYDALQTANQTQSSNRNVLRSLGILNSSAAGDLLSRPIEAYDKQRAQLLTANTQRFQQLDDFLNQKTAEHATAVRNLESQYTDLVGKIQTDLRFNDRQRNDAVKAANAALQQRLQEIQTAQYSYAADVQTQKQNLAIQIAQIKAYQNPSADINSIMASIPQLSGVSGGGSQQVSIAQGDLLKRQQQGLLSG